MSFQGLGPIVFESVSAVTVTPSVELGVRRVYAGEEYEYVYAAKTVSMGIGSVYTGTSGHTIVATGAIAGEHCAGFCKHESLVSGSYGWIMKRGVVNALNGVASSAPADGDVVYLAADASFRTGKGAAATAATDFVGGHVVGKVLSAGASGGTGASHSLLYVSVY